MRLIARAKQGFHPAPPEAIAGFWDLPFSVAPKRFQKTALTDGEPERELARSPLYQARFDKVALHEDHLVFISLVAFSQDLFSQVAHLRSICALRTRVRNSHPYPCASLLAAEEASSRTASYVRLPLWGD
jgi:hypothetical protein